MSLLYARVSEKWLLSASSDNEVEEDEAISSSDFPTKEEKQSRKESPSKFTQEEFDFGSVLFKKTEMCSADVLFFQGRILPLDNSNTSSNSSSNSVKPEGNSCRSSSLNTQIDKSRIHFYFHSQQFHPSPKPQIRYSRIRNQSSNATVWSHFRVGLLTTPEIELEDLKIRSSGNRSRSSSSTDGGMNFKGGKSDKKKRQGLLDISRCISSVNVEIVQSKVSKSRNVF